MFWFHALPPDVDAISLEDMHCIVRDVWLRRHDLELQRERTQRRQGRPKSVQEMKIEEQMLREQEEYRAGMGMLVKDDEARLNR